jgi:hypothetical protein
MFRRRPGIGFVPSPPEAFGFVRRPDLVFPAPSLASFGQTPFPPIVEAIGFVWSIGLAPRPLGSFGRPDALGSFGRPEDSPRIVPRPRKLSRSWPLGKGRNLIIESGMSRVLPFRCRVRYLRTSSD